MFHDFRFCLGTVTTHLTYRCPKCLFYMENFNNSVSIVKCLLNNAFLCVKKIYKAMLFKS